MKSTYKKALESIKNQAKKPELVELSVDRAFDLGREYEQEKKRTLPQNRAMHKNFEMIAEKLNDAGYDVRKTIKIDIPFTGMWVKEYMWKPIMKKMFKKDSTTLLKKAGEIDKCHEVLMRELGEKLEIEYHNFPNDPIKEEKLQKELMKNYPTENNDSAKIPW